MKNPRYEVEISFYKDMYMFKVLDNHWDTRKYCFYNELGWVKTNFYGIGQRHFEEIFLDGMEPGHKYYVYTDGKSDKAVSFVEVSSTRY